MSSRPETDPFDDEAPPPDIDRQQTLELAVIGLGVALLAVVLFLGMRCAVHRIEHSVALLVT